MVVVLITDTIVIHTVAEDTNHGGKSNHLPSRRHRVIIHTSHCWLYRRKERLELMRTSQTLLQAFQMALAERSADRAGEPSKDYMLGYLMGMLETMAEDIPEASDRIQGHLNELNQTLRSSNVSH